MTKPNRYKIIAAAMTCTLMGAAILPQASAQNEDTNDWRFSLSAGVLVTPTYYGDDENQVSIVPNFQVEYKDKLSASIQGVEYKAFEQDGWTIGPVLRFDFGRDEEGSNPFAISGDDTTDLEGLGDIDPTFELGGFVTYSLGVYSLTGEVRQGLGGHEGMVADLSANYSGRTEFFGRPAFYSLGPVITLADEDYNTAFFGIDEIQSSASGLSVYDAGGDLNSIGLDASFFTQINQKWALVAFAGIEQLQGDAADSSLVQSRGDEMQFNGGLFLSYQF